MLEDNKFKILENMLKKKFKNKDVLVLTGDEASEHTNIKGFIKTGSERMNLDLGGGYARGRIVEIYGPEGSAKSTLAWTAIKNEQSLGNRCAYIDVERASNRAYLEKIGVDFDLLLLIQAETAEQVWEAVEMISQTGTVSLIVIDSIAAMNPEDVLKKGISGDTMGRLAAANTLAITQINPFLEKTNTTLMLINQVRQGLDMFGPKETTPGGNIIKFFSSQRIRLKRKAVLTDSDSIPRGQTTQYQIVKNKVFSPGREGTFDLIYGVGIDQIEDLVSTALLHPQSKLEMAGSWVKFEDKTICQGIETFKKMLNEDADLMTRLTNNLKGEVVEIKNSETKSNS